TNTINNATNAKVLVAPFSSSATTVSVLGLTTFNNQGLVDIRNGHTGDVFNMPGAHWAGSGSSTLDVDATLGASLTSDKMVIGAGTGSTAVNVKDLTPAAPGALNFVGTTVVQSTGSPGAFFLVGSPIHKGFVQYELRYIGTNWNLVGLPDQ